VPSIRRRPRSSFKILLETSDRDEFSQEAFDEVFATFDKDGSGTVEKPEMVVFIKQLLGGN
jgi:Ca2+-binding EF-hand superfamily protein